MKICLIAPTYLPARRANTFQVMKMAQAMTILDHEVIVLVPESKKENPRPSWDELVHHYGLQHKFSIEWLPVSRRLRSYDYGLSTIRFAQDWGADLIYTRLPQAAALASGLGIGTIFEIHDLPQGILAPWLVRRFITGRGGRRLVVITRALREDLLLGDFPTIIAPDGVDLARYIDLPSPDEARKYLSLSDKFTVGYTGHLYTGRGVELILAIAAHLSNMVFLLVGGDPADVERVHRQVDERGLNNVTLTGFVPNADLPQYQAACDVLLMPYQRHVAASSGGDIARYLSPMKLFEYMACGRPIVSSDLPVLRETLNSDNAILLLPEDQDAWVLALQALQGDSLRREALGHRVRQDVEQYTWEARAQKILENL